MLSDPFYALTEILRSSAVAESQFLKMIALKLDRDSALLFTEPDNDSVIALSRLKIMHYRRALEAHLQDFSEMLGLSSNGNPETSGLGDTRSPVAKREKTRSGSKPVSRKHSENYLERPAT